MSTWTKTLEQIHPTSGLIPDAKKTILHGMYGGYNVILALNGSSPQLIFSVKKEGGIPIDNDDLKALKSRKNIASANSHGMSLVLSLKAAMTANKNAEKIKEALSDATQYLSSIGAVNVCMRCGQEKPTQVYTVGNEYNMLCDECFKEVSESMGHEEQMLENKPENIVGGTVGALLGSLIGAAAIVIIGQLGYVAAIAGVIMGVCTLKGYEKLGGKLTKKAIVISAVIMIIMVAVSNRLDWAIEVAKVFETDIFTAFRGVSLLLQDGSISTSSYYSGLGMQYIFALLGAVPTVLNYVKTNRNQHKVESI